MTFRSLLQTIKTTTRQGKRNPPSNDGGFRFIICRTFRIHDKSYLYVIYKGFYDELADLK